MDSFVCPDTEKSHIFYLNSLNTGHLKNKDTMGAFHLPRNSGNSGWDVNETRFFWALHWKVPGNKWKFEKVVLLSLWKFPLKSAFHLRAFTRNHHFQAVQGDICTTILFGDGSINEWNLCQMEHVLH